MEIPNVIFARLRGNVKTEKDLSTQCGMNCEACVLFQS